jgi:hypothetical protein
MIGARPESAHKALAGTGRRPVSEVEARPCLAETNRENRETSRSAASREHLYDAASMSGTSAWALEDKGSGGWLCRTTGH